MAKLSKGTNYEGQTEPNPLAFLVADFRYFSDSRRLIESTAVGRRRFPQKTAGNCGSWQISRGIWQKLVYLILFVLCDSRLDYTVPPHPNSLVVWGPRRFLEGRPTSSSCLFMFRNCHGSFDAQSVGDSQAICNRSDSNHCDFSCSNRSRGSQA